MPPLAMATPARKAKLDSRTTRCASVLVLCCALCAPLSAQSAITLHFVDNRINSVQVSPPPPPTWTTLDDLLTQLESEATSLQEYLTALSSKLAEAQQAQAALSSSLVQSELALTYSKQSLARATTEATAIARERDLWRFGTFAAVLAGIASSVYFAIR